MGNDGITIAACTGAFFAFTPGVLVLLVHLIERTRAKQDELARIESAERRQLQIGHERKCK